MIGLHYHKYAADARKIEFFWCLGLQMALRVNVLTYWPKEPPH
jgi:hypothetical protein